VACPVTEHQVHMDWGPVGAAAMAAAMAAEVYVVVDVLSFSTSVCVAVERGTTVFPFPWKDDRAGAYARERDAVLAGRRLDGAAQSLSPAALLTGLAVPRLVLPSPNGSTIASALGGEVAAGCLRNAGAVAEWLAPALRAGRPVGLVAAGERWRDDSLRPALEDHLGTGAIAAAVRLAGFGDLSEEASAAADLFEASAPRLHERLRDCVSGRELAAIGFAADVEVAAALDASTTVPVLVDGAFVPAAPTPRVAR
jgi:2-phosphosulfolactate phosphatase